MTSSKKPYLGLIGVGAIVFLLLLTSFRGIRTGKGSTGIGALIIFIAVILVAAIAAAVFISTGGSLQQKALITGNDAREGVSYGLEAISIRGSDASQGGTPHTISHITIRARLPAGSSMLSLNNTVITMDTTISATQTFLYEGTVADSVQATGTSNFAVTYLKTGPTHEDGYVTTGDTVKLKFNIDGLIGENTRVRVTIVPRSGSMNQLEFQTPETMTEPTVVLWPTN
jgi:archaeal flagellin FlaB